MKPVVDLKQYANLKTRYADIKQRIDKACTAYQRDHHGICLLAVSKGHGSAAIEQLFSLGQRHFAESYLNEALDKQRQLQHLNIDWHYVGRIQSNKTADIARCFSWVHSVDRAKIARRLDAQRPTGLAPLNICLQVNIDQEGSKGGINESEALALAEELSALPKLRLRGLMALPQRSTNFDQQRQAFARLRRLKERLYQNGIALDSLSMGMSNDFEAAIAEQATHLRIGSALFGPRRA